MRALMFAGTVLAFGVLATGMPSGSAQAAGCVSGAAVGGVAGHFAGHHGVLGAAAGCAVGHHEAVKQERARNAGRGSQPEYGNGSDTSGRN